MGNWLRRQRRSLQIVAASGALGATAGGCLPPDYFASLAGEMLSLAVGTVVSAAVDTTIAGAGAASDAARQQP